MKLQEIEQPLPACGATADGGDVVELPVLLETELAEALEEAARGQGMTTGTFVRRLLRDFLRAPVGERLAR